MQYSDKLDNLEKRFDELSDQMADPDVISDNEIYRKTAKAATWKRWSPSIASTKPSPKT
jgi:protein subunit release factor A